MVRRHRAHDPVSDEVAELAAFADESLPPDRRSALVSRVAASPELADRLAEQQRAVALAQSAAAQVHAPASLRDRVEAQRRVRRATATGRLALIAGTATAAVAVAVGVAVFSSGGGPSEGLQVALAATELAPGAEGEATVSRTSSGWRIELEATGLPRLDDGRFYEAWLRNPAGILVPIGTFNEGRHVTLWAGVTPKEFTGLTITRERTDGDQASSGEKVLVGAVAIGRSG